MTPLVRKEIRLLLPFLGIALGLAVAPVWILPAGERYIPEARDFLPAVSEYVYWVFGFGMVLLGLAPFGQEFSMGTFPSLMAQPRERQQIWTVKILLIFAAVLLVLSIFGLSLHVWLDSSLHKFIQGGGYAYRHGFQWGSRFDYSERVVTRFSSTEFQNFCRWGAIAALTAVTGGLWTSLLFRQTGAALWFTILVPGVIFMGVGWFVPDGSAGEIVSMATLGIYSIGGFIWAWRMFMRAQDAQWLGDTISLSGMSRTNTQTESAAARCRKPLRALIRKEFQSHQISLLIAFGLFVLHVCTLAFRKFYPPNGDSNLRFVLETVPGLWFVVPWLIGSVTVAEERKQGTLESQLCLPVTRRLQFAAKFSIALLFGVALGGMVPWAIERVGMQFHIHSDFITTSAGTDVGAGFILSCEIAAAIVVLSFFASTLTRNTLHALGGAIVATGALMGLYLLFQWICFAFSFGHQINTRSPLIHIDWARPALISLAISLMFSFSVPLLTVSILWRSFVQYKLPHVGWSALFRTILAILFSLLIATVASAIAVVINRFPYAIYGVRPGGGTLILFIGVLALTATVLWRSCGQYHLLRMGWKLLFRTITILLLSLLVAATITAALYERVWEFAIPLEPRHGPAQLGGSAQPKIRFTFNKVFALLPDGRLWEETSYTNLWLGDYSETREINGTSTFSKEPTVFPAAGVFMGGSNWTDIAGSIYGMIGVQSDGTLWKVFDWGSRRDRAAFSEPQKPTRIGTDSNWQSVAAGYRYYLALKQDGTIWEWATSWGNTVDAIPVNDTNGWIRVGRDSDWAKVFASALTSFAVKRDGSVWKWGDDWEARTNKNRNWLEAISRTTPIRCRFSGTNCVSIQALADKNDLAIEDNGAMQLERAGSFMLVNVLGSQVLAKDGLIDVSLHIEKPPERALADVRGVSELVGLTKTGLILENNVGLMRNPWGKAVWQPSKYNDWIAVEYSFQNMFTGLAADGTLCFWQDPFWNRRSYLDYFLGPSRKAVWSVNILANGK